MAGSMSTVFLGENINEINEAILDYVADLKEKVGAETEAAPAETPAAKKKAAAAAKKKAKAEAKKEATENTELDDLLGEDEGGAEDMDGEDAFGEEEAPAETPVEDEDEDLFGEEEEETGKATLEDVRDALGKLAKMGVGHEETAQKALKKFGGAEDLGGIPKNKYQAVYDGTMKVIAKLESMN